MTDRAESNSRAADWPQPRVERRGSSRYVETLRDRLWLIVVCSSSRRSCDPLRRHRDQDLRGRGRPADHPDLVRRRPASSACRLITESTDPTRDVETALAARRHPRRRRARREDLNFAATPAAARPASRPSRWPRATSSRSPRRPTPRGRPRTRQLASPSKPSPSRPSSCTRDRRSASRRSRQRLEEQPPHARAAQIGHARAAARRARPDPRIQTKADLPTAPGLPAPRPQSPAA